MRQEINSQNQLAQGNESRYYYIKVKRITYLCQELKKLDSLCLKMQMGTKHSQTTFQLEEGMTREQKEKRQREEKERKQSKQRGKKKNKNKEQQKQVKEQELEYKQQIKMPIAKEKWNEEAHIFMYEAEDFLNIYLEDYKVKNEKEFEKEHKHKGQKEETGKNKSTKSFIGFSRLLLTPLSQYPNTKHTVEVQFIGLDTDLKIIKAESVALVELQIYYKFDFSGFITIIPISAHLERTVAQIGQMKPIARFKLLQKIQASEQAEGGIHPRWNGHFNFKKDEHKFIKDVDEYNRYKFPLTSAGSYLQIQILSYPLIGFQPDVAGSAKIRIEDAGFLKYPRRQGQNYFQTKEVELSHKIENEKVFVGSLKLQVHFEFELYPRNK